MAGMNAPLSQGVCGDAAQLSDGGRLSGSLHLKGLIRGLSRWGSWTLAEDQTTSVTC